MGNRANIRRTAINTKATARNTRASLELARAQAAAQWQREQREHAYRYETDPNYRDFVNREHARLLARQEAERQRIMQRDKRLLQLGSLALLSLAILLAAAFVWAPQLLLTKIRGKEVSLWRRAALTAAWWGAAPAAMPTAMRERRDQQERAELRDRK